MTQCPQSGNLGFHSEEYYDDGSCKWCGEVRLCKECKHPESEHVDGLCTHGAYETETPWWGFGWAYPCNCGEREGR
jgi:hypothetical protein